MVYPSHLLIHLIFPDGAYNLISLAPKFPPLLIICSSAGIKDYLHLNQTFLCQQTLHEDIFKSLCLNYFIQIAFSIISKRYILFWSFNSISNPCLFLRISHMHKFITNIGTISFFKIFNI